jgi:hypothetical protein
VRSISTPPSCCDAGAFFFTMSLPSTLNKRNQEFVSIVGVPKQREDFFARTKTRARVLNCCTINDSNEGTYKGVSKSSRTGRLERELQMVQLSATRCSYIAILWVSLVSFATITLCIGSRQVFVVVVVVVHFVIDSVRKILNTPS